MKNYTITITQVTEQTVSVRAKNSTQAKNIAWDQYKPMRKNHSLSAKSKKTVLPKKPVLFKVAHLHHHLPFQVTSRWLIHNFDKEEMDDNDLTLLDFINDSLEGDVWCSETTKITRL